MRSPLSVTAFVSETAVAIAEARVELLLTTSVPVPSASVRADAQNPGVERQAAVVRGRRWAEVFAVPFLNDGRRRAGDRGGVRLAVGLLTQRFRSQGDRARRAADGSNRFVEAIQIEERRGKQLNQRGVWNHTATPSLSRAAEADDGVARVAIGGIFEDPRSGVELVQLVAPVPASAMACDRILSPVLVPRARERAAPAPSRPIGAVFVKVSGVPLCHWHRCIRRRW